MSTMLNKIYRMVFPPKHYEEIRIKYNIPKDIAINVRLTQDGWFVLSSPDLPGLITEAPNGKELIKKFNDALLTYYDVPRREGDVVHNRLHLGGHGVFFLNNSEVEQVA